MAKAPKAAKPRSPSVLSFACGICRASVEAPVGSALQLLQLCATCQDARFAKGLAEQRRTEAAEGQP